jgi:hypothetical protein
VAETVRFPELAASFYRSGPAQTRRAPVRRLAASDDRRANCVAADPEFAATLLSMLVGAERSHYLLSGDPPPEPDPAWVVQIIDCYLRAFAPPESDPSSPDRPTEYSMRKYIPLLLLALLAACGEGEKKAAGGPAPGAGMPPPGS